jgi:hypothetical protein
MQTRINLGIRHILPIYPLMYMWIAAVLFSRQVVIPAFLRKAAVVCLALVVPESASVFPRYLGFFNLPSGGPRQGWKYLVDSNLDWGQDLKRLKSYLVDRGYSNVCLNYFGTALPSYLRHRVQAGAGEPGRSAVVRLRGGDEHHRVLRVSSRSMAAMTGCCGPSPPAR